MTAPLTMPPAAAVYVKLIVRPVCDAETLLIEAAIVPEPFAALIVIDGEAARFVKTPPAVERSWSCHVCAPVAAVAVAPGPPPAFEPYVIVTVDPAVSVIRGHGHDLARDSDGACARGRVAGVDGADRRRSPPCGIVSLTPPLDMSPAATVYVKTTVFPVCEAETFVVGVVAVPEPSGA